MPDEAERRRQHDLAHRRLIAYRYARSDHPRVRVRLPRDPIARNGLLATILGLLLILLARLLDARAIA